MDPRYRWFQIKLKSRKDPSRTLTCSFRGFTLAESRRAGGRTTPIEVEQFLLEQCTWGLDLATTDLSVCSKILAEIYHVSGWDGEGSPYKLADAWLHDEAGSLEAAAICMIPGLTLQELDTCDPHDRAKYLIMGKWLFESLYHPATVEQVFCGKEPEAKPTVESLKRMTQSTNNSGMKEVEGFNWDSRSRTANILPPTLEVKPPDST